MSTDDFRTIPAPTLHRTADQLAAMIEEAGDYATRDAIDALTEARAFLATPPLRETAPPCDDFGACVDQTLP